MLNGFLTFWAVTLVFMLILGYRCLAWKFLLKKLIAQSKCRLEHRI